ncbi:MAG: SH3 domain-containing protein [Devosia sp.]
MSIKRLHVSVAIAAAGLLACSCAALAVEAAAKSAVNVRTGPGTTYGIVDQLVAGEVVEVTECAPSNFCFVERDGPDGWVSANYLTSLDEEEEDEEEGGGSNPDCSFGFVIGPDGPQMSINCGDAPMPPPPPVPPEPEDEGDEPLACFYTGNNFTGDELCVGVGIRNSLNGTFNNKISSVELFNGAKARMCDGANLTGTCRNVTVDTTPLHPQINNLASSFTVFTGPAPMPLPPPPEPLPTFETYSTGPIDLPQTWEANLDNGNVGGGGVDIWYRAVTSTEKYITPRNGAGLALGDGSNRGYEGCAEEDFSGDPIALEDMPVGTYVCAKTNQGRISQFRVNGFTGTTMRLGYTTWSD